ncbi:hypothetical protein FHX14_002620 [Rhizobium sp. BK619]|uniref:hypothetical protein n=1 Tax=Rhizobium sp. BK619 TaxID=2586989 RepID=UPI00160AA21E|nr:hypothetical protein [Rhizobium sp. BK619]MBB3646423.1 hypothetical protein [Rhizobium sp. BK619]
MLQIVLGAPIQACLCFSDQLQSLQADMSALDVERLGRLDDQLRMSMSARRRRITGGWLFALVMPR